MNAITVNNVTKIYPIYKKNSDRVREVLSLTHKTYNRPFYALNGISFEIEKGETVGIIGTNGSGKSTILKIITGVVAPTSGSIKVDGKVSALLELGAGFDLEYTGIENIYMNGSILGYTREEMDQKIPEILEFADIGDFVYQQVKTYSSGMLVRLAFALAINVNPEVLIIDEALAVGDAFFQAKCFTKLEEIKERGTTILFVSHDIISVKKLCKRAIWIEKGNLREIGDAKDVCEHYLSMQIEEQNREKQKIVDGLSLDNVVIDIKKGDRALFPKIHIDEATAVTGEKDGEIISFYVRNEKNQDVTVLKTGEAYQFGMVVEFHKSLENVLFGFEMENVRGVKLFSINNFLSNEVLESAKDGECYDVSFTIELPKICTGEYLVSPSLAVGNQNNHVVVERIHNYMKITVDNDGYNLAVLDLDAKAQFVKYKKEDIELY